MVCMFPACCFYDLAADHEGLREPGPAGAQLEAPNQVLVPEPGPSPRVVQHCDRRSSGLRWASDADLSLQFSPTSGQRTLVFAVWVS